jgi:ferritin
MLKPEIEKALNEQINCEQSASQEYLAIAGYFEGLELRGFARFMRRQAREEQAHALRLFDHVVDRGGQISLGDIPAPPSAFDSVLAAFEAAYEREKANTRSIHKLYKLALDLSDYATQTMLHWFIEEQVEEEQWCEEATSLLSMAGDDQAALIVLDEKYGKKAESKD